MLPAGHRRRHRVKRIEDQIRGEIEKASKGGGMLRIFIRTIGSVCRVSGEFVCMCVRVCLHESEWEVNVAIGTVSAPQDQSAGVALQSLVPTNFIVFRI